VRWEAQRHTAFSLLSFEGIRDHLALNAPKITPEWKSAVITSFAGAVQNAPRHP
jgi:hypothetical protein